MNNQEILMEGKEGILHGKAKKRKEKKKLHLTNWEVVKPKINGGLAVGKLYHRI